MRHTFASWAIAAGLPTFEIAATMGTLLGAVVEDVRTSVAGLRRPAGVALNAFLALGNQAAEAGH